MSEDRSNRQLVPVPGARNAQAWAAFEQPREARIRAKMSADPFEIRVEIEKALDSFDDLEQSRNLRETDRRDEVRSRRRRSNLDEAGGSIQHDRADVAPVVADFLDAADRARPEPARHRVPIVGSAIGQRQNDDVVAAGVLRSAARSSQLRRRAPVDVVERLVEAAHASVAGRHRNLRHRQGRVVQQQLCKEQTPVLHDRDRRRAEMFGEEAAQVPLADSEPRRKTIEAFVVQRAAGDQRQGAIDSRRRSVPGC